MQNNVWKTFSNECVAVRYENVLDWKALIISPSKMNLHIIIIILFAALEHHFVTKENSGS